MCALWTIGFLLAAYCAAISVQLERIEGRHSPLTHTKLILAAFLVLEFIFPLLILQGAAYRDNRPDEIVQALDDVASVSPVAPKIELY